MFVVKEENILFVKLTVRLVEHSTIQRPPIRKPTQQNLDFSVLGKVYQLWTQSHPSIAKVNLYLDKRYIQTEMQTKRSFFLNMCL